MGWGAGRTYFFGVVRAQGKVTGGRAWAQDRFRDWSGGEGCLTLGAGGRESAPSDLSRAAGPTGWCGLLGGRPHPFWAEEKRGLGDVDPGGRGREWGPSREGLEGRQGARKPRAPSASSNPPTLPSAPGPSAMAVEGGMKCVKILHYVFLLAFFVSGEWGRWGRAGRVWEDLASES